MKRQSKLQTTGRWMSSVTGAASFRPAPRALDSESEDADEVTLNEDLLLHQEGTDETAANDGLSSDSAGSRAGGGRSGYDPAEYGRSGDERAVSERVPVHPSRATSGVAARFTGALEDLAVADLLQILQLAGKSAVITVTRNGAHSHLWCSEGELIDAESGRLRGEAAVYRILGFSEGWLVADLRPATSTRTIFGSMQQVLLEAARQRDESSALRRKLGDPQCCYRLGKSLPPEELATLGSAEVRLLRSCADTPSLSELLDSSELGELATLTALERWIEGGQIVSAGLRFSARTQPRESAITARTPQSVRAPVARSRVTPTPSQPMPAPAQSMSVPAQRSRAWVWAVVGALGFFASGYVLRGRTVRAPEPTAAALALGARPNTEAVPKPESYPIVLHVEPASAEIWLDHQRAGVGSLSTQAARDGKAHELRVTAAGFAPAAIVFVDAAPPAQLRLEPLAPVEAQPPLPVPSRAAAVPQPDPAPLAPQTVQRQAVPQPARENVGDTAPRRPGRGSPALRQEPRPRLRDKSPTASVKPQGTPHTEPQVQIIGNPEPVVRVLD